MIIIIKITSKYKHVLLQSLSISFKIKREHLLKRGFKIA